MFVVAGRVDLKCSADIDFVRFRAKTHMRVRRRAGHAGELTELRGAAQTDSLEFGDLAYPINIGVPAGVT